VSAWSSTGGEFVSGGRRANHLVRDGLTVIHGPLLGPLIIPVPEVHRSGLKIEPRRDAVHRAHVAAVFWEL
jgi:hypothetical protein